MKKKILSIALAVAILAIASIGTLAYFTETTPKKDNVFTVGNVHIALDENFDENTANLVPGSKTTTAIPKQVFLENTGLNDAYVRVHIAIPSILDNAQPDFDASRNVLHFNNSNMATGQWNWSTTLVRPDGDYTQNNNWNFYTTTIGGISYNVYVVTYETKLAHGEKTPAAMDQVYLDAGTTQNDIARINQVLTNGWHMYVVAEAVQAAGFSDAFSAFAASFKTIGSYNPFVAP